MIYPALSSALETFMWFYVMWNDGILFYYHSLLSLSLWTAFHELHETTCSLIASYLRRYAPCPDPPLPSLSPDIRIYKWLCWRNPGTEVHSLCWVCYVGSNWIPAGLWLILQTQFGNEKCIFFQVHLRVAHPCCAPRNSVILKLTEPPP